MSGHPIADFKKKLANLNEADRRGAPPWSATPISEALPVYTAPQPRRLWEAPLGADENDVLEVDPDRAADYQEERDDILLALDRRQETAEYSRTLLDMHNTTYVPSNCNRLVVSHNLVEACGPLHNNSRDMVWKPTDAALAFGSGTDYAQGNDVAPLDYMAGNLENTFMLEVSISCVRNDFPYSVGVTFGTMVTHKNKTTEWEPLEGGSVVSGHTKYHAILPRLHAARMGGGNERVCFRSKHTLDHYFGKRFPSFYSGNLDLGISGTARGMKLIPLHSPVTDYILQFAGEGEGKRGWPHPTLAEEGTHASGFFVCDGAVVSTALEEVGKIFDTYMKISDLGEFQVRLERLNSSEVGKADAAKAGAVQQALSYDIQEQDNLCVSFLMSTTHVFKDRNRDIDFSRFDEDE
jgi:hypothetical protein